MNRLKLFQYLKRKFWFEENLLIIITRKRWIRNFMSFSILMPPVKSVKNGGQDFFTHA